MIERRLAQVKVSHKLIIDIMTEGWTPSEWGIPTPQLCFIENTKGIPEGSVFSHHYADKRGDVHFVFEHWLFPVWEPGTEVKFIEVVFKQLSVSDYLKRLENGKETNET